MTDAGFAASAFSSARSTQHVSAQEFVHAFSRRYSYPLDHFQRQACEEIGAGRGVLVCAPTGSGKTVVGECAVFAALTHGTKCFYTTPIKALSNQKFHDLVAQFGADKVGLLTGDVSINGHADVVVMTTEVLRNMIYAGSHDLSTLSHVVMDEIHFLADKSRGAVWEEVILNLPESVRVVGLSATVSNSEEFGDWLSTVRGDTAVVVTDKRPVPLEQWMLAQRRLFPLFSPTDPSRVNEELLAYTERLETRAETRYQQVEKFAPPQQGGFRSRAKGGGRAAYSQPQKSSGSRRSGRSRSRDAEVLGRPEVLSLLNGQNMLPAIVFIFSRAGCESAVYQCLRARTELTTPEEQSRIQQIVDRGVADIPAADLEVLQFDRWRLALTRGIAAHHAGMLPAFRHIVEELFTEGLLKAVFATETLALGINMPARTVVLERMVKFDGESHVDLTPAQYTQLTGRAGRRGIDTLGNAVVRWEPTVDPAAVAGLASTRTYPLLSTFAPGYNMCVNLLGTMGYRAAQRLLESSFAQYQADKSVVGTARKLDHLRLERDRLQQHFHDAISAAGPRGASDAEVVELMEGYVRLRRELTLAEKEASQRSRQEQQRETAAILRSVQPGDVLALPTHGRPTLAVVTKPAHNHHHPRVWLTTAEGWTGPVDTDAFANSPVVVGHVHLSGHLAAHPRRFTRRIVDILHNSGITGPKKLKIRRRVKDSDKIQDLRRQLREHPCHAWPDRESLVRSADDYLRADKKIHQQERTIASATGALTATFDRITELLEEYAYVVRDPEGEYAVSEEGENLARLHSESDLLVAQCLRRGIWDGLDPAELAGVVSACTFENRKTTRGEPEMPTEPLATAVSNTFRIWDEIIVDEQRHRLEPTRQPDPAFALAIHQWTAGAPLGYCLAAANQCGAELTPGDFVRQARQVVDLLDQVRDTGYSEEITRAARQAVAAIKRGVVALGA